MLEGGDGSDGAGGLKGSRGKIYSESDFGRTRLWFFFS